MTDPWETRRGLRIGELASLVGVTTRTVRHYHDVGVLPEPNRDTAGYRRYPREDVLALKRIVRLRVAGVPLEDIVRLHDGGWNETDVAEALTARAQQVQDEITRLHSLHEELRELAEHLPYDLSTLPPGHTVTLGLRARAGQPSR